MLPGEGQQVLAKSFHNQYAESLSPSTSHRVEEPDMSGHGSQALAESSRSASPALVIGDSADMSYLMGYDARALYTPQVSWVVPSNGGWRDRRASLLRVNAMGTEMFEVSSATSCLLGYRC